MLDDLSGRQNVILGAEAGDLNRLLDAVANQFGTDWLAGNDGNPVQTLWQRKERAVDERVAVARRSHREPHRRKPLWVSRQIREIKEGREFLLLG
jgi:hypothetical protein